jgi:hypothetical protein
MCSHGPPTRSTLLPGASKPLPVPALRLRRDRPIPRVGNRGITGMHASAKIDSIPAIMTHSKRAISSDSPASRTSHLALEA